ncbi:MAG TPA: carboxymuconolactone decarboxylase family protein [Candidatus Binataceae bacterium]|jgi:alkylhydroperoxidase family enzyme
MGAVARVVAPQGKTGDPIRDSALGLVPETVDQIARLNHHAWRSSPVRASLLEIVRLRNARTVNCQFCKSVRYDVARRDGLTENKVDQIADGYEQSGLSDEEKLAVAFADAYLHEPKAMSAELASRLKKHFTPAQLAHLAIALIAFNATSRCAVTIGGMPENLPVTEISAP